MGRPPEFILLSAGMTITCMIILPPKSGFTLIELILVVAIVSTLAVATAPFVSRFSAVNNLEVATDKTVSTFRKAQQYAMDNKNDTTWGVCKTGNNLRLFSGTCASPTLSEDFDLSSVTTSGFTQITFTNKRGEPSGTVSITLSNSVGTKTVTMNSGGGMDRN